MTWFYTQMVEWHVLLAWCSVALFASRGLLFQFGTPRLQAVAKDPRLLVLVFGVNACLVITGLGLWAALGYHPVQSPWLGAKLLALFGYLACSHWAMSQGRLHAVGYLAALVLLAIVMQLSIRHQLLPG